MIPSRRVSTLMPPLWATTFYVVFLKIREFLSQEPTPLTTGELASPRSLPRPSASALEGRHDSYTPPCMKDDQSAHISCKSSCRAHRYQKTAEPNYVSSALAATGRIRYCCAVNWPPVAFENDELCYLAVWAINFTFRTS